ncbi:hypothetical protein JVU11DRAFT_12605 [Chiua virens]|nr:hypothetical protein JVU11DRAFT_12605 [Chiua virens]
MLTEGEANLHFYVANLSPDMANDATPQGVVIIDAGSETVDLSMFSMTSNPVSGEEIAPPECRLQGLVFVTRRAQALLEKKLGGWGRSGEDNIAEFTREFEQSTMLIIKSDQEPVYVRVAGRRYANAKYNITSGKLKLSGEEATALFKESIEAIIKAFEEQQEYAAIPISVCFTSRE